MREIKFRAWDKIKNKMWFKSDAIHYIFLNDIEQSKCIIMQYTGMKDKNGIEIYEGDKVRLPMWFARDDPARGSCWNEGVVVYKDCEFMIESGDDGFYDNMGALFSWNNLEIIGDIHRNPDSVGDTT